MSGAVIVVGELERRVNLAEKFATEGRWSCKGIRPD